MTGYPPEMQRRIALERELADFQITQALSLTQPWATLVIIGAKLFETRSWPTGYRGWLAIQAAKGFPRACQDLCYQQPFAAHLAAAGYNKPSDLPRGEVLGVVNLTACLSTNVFVPESSVEYDFGDYSHDRYAWKFEGVRRLREPFAAKGALSLWKLPRPITLADLDA